MIITIWRRYNKTDDGGWVWEFNHIENGYDREQLIPKSKFPDVQRSWNGCKWQKDEGVLRDLGPDRPRVVSYIFECTFPKASERHLLKGSLIEILPDGKNLPEIPDWPKNAP